MKRLAIFDLDGTLLNTITDLAIACNYALSKCGYPTHDVSEYPLFVGNGILKLIERSLPAQFRTEEEIKRIRNIFVPYYDTHNTIYTHPYEGINELLTQLHTSGVAIAVASNKYHSATQHIINHYFSHIPFVAILGQRDHIAKKPHPAIVEEILAISHIPQEDTIYIGDSDVDMLTAINAGVESIGVTWGFCSKEKLFNACHLADNAQMLWQYIINNK